MLFAAASLARTAAADDDRSRPAAPGSTVVAAPAQMAATLALRIVGPDGNAIARAKIDLQSAPRIQAEQIARGKYLRRLRFGDSLQADADGRIVLERPAHWQRLDVYIKLPGYAGYWAGWDPQANSEPIPASLTVKLEPAWTVGGIVVDGDGKPVPNARVSLRIEFTKRPGESRQLGTGDRVWTNSKGEWTFASVPTAMDSVRVIISDPNYTTFRQNLDRADFGIEQGHSPRKKITLRAGLTVTGKVTDEVGRPIAKALVRTKFLTDLRRAVTDENGVYRLENCERRKARIVVSAKGCARELQTVEIRGGMKPLDFELRPGQTIRIRVLDERGNPVPKARVYFRAWRGRVHSFEFEDVSPTADEHGLWEWNEAPVDWVTVDIVRPSGMTLSERTLTARNEEYVFKVPGQLVVSGKVIDVETRKPIEKFRVIPGVRWSENRMAWDTNGAFTAVNGQYRLHETYGQPAYFLRIEAEGFRSAVSRDIKSDEGSVTVDFELSKGKNLSATVLTPDGAPAAGAKVGIGYAASRMGIFGGDLQSIATNSQQRETDQSGRLDLGLEDGDFQVVVTHRSGYALFVGMPSPNPKIIKLSPWAKVEGTFRVARKPKRDVHIKLTAQLMHQFGQKLAVIDVQDLQSTDASGRFGFERVVFGRWRIGILGGFGVDSPPITSGCATVNCSAGKTTHVEFGASGRPVIGQVRRPPDSNADFSWANALVTIDSDDPQPKETAWTFSASVDRDGSFAIDDVRPGSYRLNVRLPQQFNPRSPGHRFTVPAVDEKLSQRPVDLGVLTPDQANR
jgi:protocatechuate 3,4-dioxygenase beta subunit